MFKSTMIVSWPKQRWLENMFIKENFFIGKQNQVLFKQKAIAN